MNGDRTYFLGMNDNVQQGKNKSIKTFLGRVSCSKVFPNRLISKQ